MYKVLTTGYRSFAECQGHSAKPKKHWAKDLPSVTLDKQHSANPVSANASLLSVFCQALGKDVAECPKNTRQTFFFKKKARRHHARTTSTATATTIHAAATIHASS